MTEFNNHVAVVTGARSGIGKAIAESLRDELNPQGLRVLSIYPGRTASPMFRRI